MNQVKEYVNVKEYTKVDSLIEEIYDRKRSMGDELQGLFNTVKELNLWHQIEP